MSWVGTSWKMNKTLAEARDYATRLAAALSDGAPAGVQPFIIPPATAITTVRDILGPDSPVVLGIQNAHWADAGAWTGEISVPQAADAGARLVEIGHSERREFFAETDETVNLKVKATLAHGLRPLLCVGEPGEVFAAGGSVAHIMAQVAAALDGIDDVSRVLIAYEPIWAIGTGKVATPEQAQEAIGFVRALVAGRSPEQAERCRVLYGGSVKPDNATELLALPDVDGALVGGASLEPDSFAAIVAAAPR